MILRDVHTQNVIIQSQIQYACKYLTPVLNLGQCDLFALLLRSVRLPGVNSGSGK